MGRTVNHQSLPVVQRLKQLSVALEEGKKKCEEVISSIPHNPIRKSIEGLEQQSAKYAVELKEQILTLGGNMHSQQTEDNPASGAFKKRIGNIEKEVTQICRKIEGSIIKLYRVVLRDSIMDDGLKQMIRSQMNGIMCRTLQLKLLSKFFYTG